MKFECSARAVLAFSSMAREVVPPQYALCCWEAQEAVVKQEPEVDINRAKGEQENKGTPAWEVEIVAAAK
eukprot:9070073-Lingulodinium_polyedra.AAC.1